MRCDEALKLIPDRDDGLLQPGARAALDEHLRTCSRCDQAAAEARALRTVLFRPEDVGTPPADLPARIVTEVQRPPQRARPRPVWLFRYAAAFAAGVLVTLAVQGSPAAPAAPPAEPSEQVVEPIPEMIKISAPRSPRRLR